MPIYYLLAGRHSGLAECRATTAEAQARRQENQIKGMRWQLQCMQQSITKYIEAAGNGKC
jgi:hypothetical protein